MDISSLIQSAVSKVRDTANNLFTPNNIVDKSTGVPSFLGNALASGQTILGSAESALSQFQPLPYSVRDYLGTSAQTNLNNALSTRQKTGTMGSFDQGFGSGLNTTFNVAGPAVKTGLTAAGSAKMLAQPLLSNAINLVVGSAIGGGLNKLNGGSFQEGAIGGALSTPLYTGAGVLGGKLLGPVMSKINPNQVESIKPYLNLLNNPEVSDATKSTVRNLLFKNASRNILASGLEAGTGNAIVGATEKANNLQERLANTGQAFGTGALFGAGTKALGYGVEGVVNNLNRTPSPEELSRMRGSIQFGKSRIHPEDLNEMKDFVDYTSKTWKPFDKYTYEASIRDLAQHYGINPEQPNYKLASTFKRILNQEWSSQSGHANFVGDGELLPSGIKINGKTDASTSALPNTLDQNNLPLANTNIPNSGVSEVLSPDIGNINQKGLNPQIKSLAMSELSQTQPILSLPAGEPNLTNNLRNLNEAKIADKTQTKLPKLKTPELLPWELPQDVSATLSPKKITPEQLGTDTIKAELNQPETTRSQPQKIISPNLENDIKNTEKLAPGKVNLLDWMRTPDRVLTKLGLRKEADAIRTSYNNYLDQLPVELNKVNKWYEQVKADPTASQRIFKYLDGQDGVILSKTEKKVANEMQAYLKEWADKLDLPYDKRIASYITHIFEPDFIKKDFDEDIAKIIADKIPGSVYDPFLQQRLGAKGYVEDAFRAMDAYVKRATRKVNMDPALEMLKKGGEKLPLESMNYVKSYADRINMRPTMVDSLLDNLVKESPLGYKFGQRPVTSISKKARQAVYRGTLGLNFGSALRNLTQGVNTYSKLGEKYTAQGYIKAIPEILSGSKELQQVGVLRDNIIQDRQTSAFKGLMEKVDSGLFAFFNLAEKINRGSAYFGAKAKYLSEGLSEEQAIKKAVDLVRQTQFTFGNVDTPVALQSDLVKTFTQFQSFNVKQTEFLAEMIKNKEFAGAIRWAGANLLLIASVGKLIGLQPKDMVPFYSILSGESKLGETPPIKLFQDVYGAAINAPDKYGNTSQDPALIRIKDALAANAPAFIPAGVQIKKTLQGIQGVQQHGSYNKSGNLQYPIDETTGNYVRAGLFGKNNLDEAQNYFNTKPSPLSEKQTDFYKNLTGQAQKDFYTQTLARREEDKALESTKDAIKKGNETSSFVGEKIVYQDEGGDIKTINLNKITSMPSNTNYQKQLKQEATFKILDDLQKANLAPDKLTSTLTRLGINKDQFDYYNVARQSDAAKTAWLQDKLTTIAQQGGTHADLIKALTQGRVQVGGKSIVSTGVLTDLYDKGLITYQEKRALGQLSYDNNGGLKVKRSGTGKAKKIKLSKPRKISNSKFGKLKRVKFKKLKIKPLAYRPLKFKLSKQPRIRAI